MTHLDMLVLQHKRHKINIVELFWARNLTCPFVMLWKECTKQIKLQPEHV